LPPGFVPQTRVDGVITVGSVPNVVYVGRPVIAKPNSDASIFRLDPDGQHATRVPVHFGQISVNTIEVKSGLQPGDRVIVSDMTPYQTLDRITVH
jgi:HlyD family secretion protein